MAPTSYIRSVSASSEHLRTVVSRSVSSTFETVSSKHSVTTSRTSLASFFALILREALQFSRRMLLASTAPSNAVRREPVQPVFLQPSTHLDKRQNAILAIPTTYAGLNSGPAPGALVGIVLGSVGGFILVLYIILSAFRLSGWGGGREVVQEEIIRHHRRRPSRSSPSSRSHSQPMSHVSSPRSERIVVEEDIVEVEEHHGPPSVEEDYVEVIEEHSPERSPPPRKTSHRSGFRTVDPAQFGGGGRPMRKVSRR
ncbi:uncharacterized protein Z519_05204 [Cladophialophora bantiana CBS 173.52]|uniref:Uncharacterized protein n=1 Tax=Cladophialophora bantiana (strain ATCC 10958 / CBS 173.52 / CDC B-1940 / NIH 8579) TaxID=1442370 RepID=A0A0D2IAS1_CLAB1|nr:uncharacterized protein Z519_05204 [Cladophialophora bantiana CBS 173.52]KIW93889.1 hypothetical protein Z519_05204 [Cladophialophora bantiana CBS 173.52]